MFYLIAVFWFKAGFVSLKSDDSATVPYASIVSATIRKHWMNRIISWKEAPPWSVYGTSLQTARL